MTKISFKRSLSLILAFIMTLACISFAAVDSQAAVEGNYSYAVYGNEATILGMVSYMSGDIDIPRTLGGCTVTAIYDDAFKSCTSFKNVVIPDTVISIGNGAFRDCSGMESVVIPKSVTTIGNDAFKNCSSLKNITVPEGVITLGDNVFSGCAKAEIIKIPSTVTSIGECAFLGCNVLQSIIVSPDSNFYRAYSDGILFSRDESVLIHFPSGKNDTSFSIPASVTEISKYAFNNCITLESITVHTNVTNIGDFAFSGCTSLTDFTVPGSVKALGSSVFDGCTGLTECKLLSGITAINFGMFKGCTSLRNVQIPNSVTSIEGNAFENCTSLESIGLHDNISIIGSNVFSGCTSLTSITLPLKITALSNGTFSNCTNLSSITFKNNLKSIGEKAFENCTSLDNVVFTINIKTIGDRAFYGCTNLKNITFSKNTTDIGEYVFYNCYSLTDISFPANLKTIGTYAFYNCYNIKELILPKSLTRIGSSAFGKCDGLISITIPFVGEKSDGSGKTHFGYIFGSPSYKYHTSHYEGSYYYREWYQGYVPTSLKNITITTTKTIPDYAFHYCSNIENITIQNSVTSIGSYAFYDCDSIENIVIPSSVTRIGSRAFYDCEGMEWVSLTNRLTYIGDYAFYTYTTLDVLFNNSTSSWNDISKGYSIFYSDYFHQYTTEIDGHYMPITVETPTCTGSGVSGMICGCGHIKNRQSIAALGHDTVNHPGVAPTCVTSGYAAYKTCRRCSYTTYTELPATGVHSGGTATCVSKAVCSVCRNEYGIIDANNHNLVNHPGKNPTCNDVGYAPYQSCTRCDYDTYSIIPATGKHSGGTATCVSKAVCDTCHKEYGEIDNTNHDTVSHPGKTATCVEAGYNAYVTCTRCDYTTYSELPATGAHTAGDWVTVTEPTETSEGLRTKSCTVCGGEVERETLPMLSTLVYGDVNGDGSINLSDVSKVLQYIAKWEVKDFDPAAADVNGDGKVNLTDASRMLQYIAKWDVVLGK